MCLLCSFPISTFQYHLLVPSSSLLSPCSLLTGPFICPFSPCRPVCDSQGVVHYSRSDQLASPVTLLLVFFTLKHVFKHPYDYPSMSFLEACHCHCPTWASRRVSNYSSPFSLLVIIPAYPRLHPSLFLKKIAVYSPLK